MKRLPTVVGFVARFPLCLVVKNNGEPVSPSGPPAVAASDSASTAPAATAYSLVAWTELGMHCDDGKDYSVFAILPPYNVIHAQLYQKAEPPVPITSGVTVTYQAMADATGSINTISSTKTNFWDFVQPLFLASPAPDLGLVGYRTQTKRPLKMAFNITADTWDAIGIPTVNYDDNNNFNALPMAKIVAKDSTGKVLARTSLVLSVSDEISCNVCHGSNTDPDAMPATGWVNLPDPSKDAKFNILKKHDDRWDISSYLGQLEAKGYFYQASLYETASSGTPILCAACHSDNALGLPGLAGIGAEASDVHTLHGPQILQSNGLTLDQNSATSDLNSCYLCHPGQITKCKRGAMNTQLCSSCHGNLTFAGNPSRQPWFIETGLPDVPQHEPALPHRLRHQRSVAPNH